MKNLFFVYVFFSVAYAHSQDFRFLPDTMGTVLHKSGFIIDFNESTALANWVAYELTIDELDFKVASKRNYRKDSSVMHGYTRSDYPNRKVSGSNYERGHLKPLRDSMSSQAQRDDCNLMTNITPQDSRLNQEVWKVVEEKTRKLVTRKYPIYIITGPSPEFKEEIVGVWEWEVPIPKFYWKVIIQENDIAYSLIAFIMPNDISVKGKSESEYAISIDELEREVGIDFLQVLDDNVENQLESRDDFDWFLTKSH